MRVAREFPCAHEAANHVSERMSTHAEMLPKLTADFTSRFGAAPQFAVWSPGRVNLIGEHTDYNMLPVLPMAIGRGFLLVVGARQDSKIRVVNVDESFAEVAFDASDNIAHSESGNWANYVKAAIQKAWPLLNDKPHGFNAVAWSNLPPASGLSSSSALVIASYMALAACNKLVLDPLEVGELMRQAERYVGTASGGMDQASIALGREGHALLINFEPLKADHLPVPSDVVFFAINSMEEAAKAGAAKFEYNRRTLECRLGLELLRRGNAEAAAWSSLRDAYDYYAAHGLSHSREVVAAISPEPFTVERARKDFGEVFENLLNEKQIDISALPASFGGFQPFSRVMHVLQETDRVHAFALALQRNDIETMALLMAGSHQSCRDLYNISTPRLEGLVSQAINSGALAARITGAGFGGCIVAMVATEFAEQFMVDLWEKFFVPLQKAGAREFSRDEVIIRADAAGGARWWNLHEASMAGE